MDYFTFIVHVFTPQTRAFYSLERLWGDAERIEVSDEEPASAVSPLRQRVRGDHPRRGRCDRLRVLLAPACAACATAARPSRPRGPVCAACWQSIAIIRAPCLLTRAAIRCRPGASISARSPSARVAARRRGARQSRARDRRLRGRAARDRPRAEVRRRAARWRPGWRMLLAETGARRPRAAPTSSCRCRCTARGSARAASIRPRTSRGSSDPDGRARCSAYAPTPSQTDLPAAERHANVRGAFAAARGVSVSTARSWCWWTM